MLDANSWFSVLQRNTLIYRYQGYCCEGVAHLSRTPRRESWLQQHDELEREAQAGMSPAELCCRAPDKAQQALTYKLIHIKNVNKKDGNEKSFSLCCIYIDPPCMIQSNNNTLTLVILLGFSCLRFTCGWKKKAI